MWDNSEDESELVSAHVREVKEDEDEYMDMTPITPTKENDGSGNFDVFGINTGTQGMNCFSLDPVNERSKELQENTHYKALGNFPQCGSPKSLGSAHHWSNSRREIHMYDYKLPLDELCMAAMHGNLPMVKTLLKKGIAVDQVVKGGWTCLLFACSSCHPQVVEYLLQQGADANMHKELFTPLMAACASTRESEDDLLECVNLLISYGAKVDVCERHRMTPLMFASKEDHVKLVQCLIKAKVDINRLDNRGWSALSWAAMRGHGRVVRVLLQHSADPTRMDIHGQRPADIALSAGFPQIADVLDRSIAKCSNETIDQTVDGVTTTSQPSTLSKMADTFGELEMVLTGLNLPHMIPIFQKHQVTFEVLLRLTEKDLEDMNITAVGVRKSILHAIKEINKKEWKTSSLPNVALNAHLTLPECAAILTNINKHIRYMHATLGYLRDQLQANPVLLQLGQEAHTVSSISSQCGDSLKHLRSFTEEVKFLKYHLDKVSGNAEHTPGDLIMECVNSGRPWQRHLIASLATTTALVTVLWYSRPNFFARIFNISVSPESVTLDI